MSTASTLEGTIPLRIHAVTWEAEDVHTVELRPPQGGELPPFTAGAHIDLHLANGLGRSYSLVNSEGERHRYVIAVQKDRASRGGSRFVHDRLHVGDIVPVSPPRNNFALVEDAKDILLIAGGIGVTPLWCMIQRLEQLQRPWSLVYCVRTHAVAAFLEPLEALARRGARVRFNFDGEPGGQMLDIAALVAATPLDTHLYCCGPLPMLDAFELATAERPREMVHVEYFTPKAAPALEGGFTVHLQRSNLTLRVPPGRTILETVLEAGVAAACSCLEGVCGTCETAVIEGVPEHRDSYLTEDEHAANRTMMICCSGSKGDRLVLDL
jgi:vanillate O-demethylase ferredoxin subunit